MASQRDIRRRIRDVGRIKQITRAMQFVAASKLKRAQDATLASRPYSEKLDEVLADLAAVLSGDDHPLLADRAGGTRLIVGTGADGALPITPEVREEAQRRGFAIDALPTGDACCLLAELEPRDVYAILHVTC